MCKFINSVFAQFPCRKYFFFFAEMVSDDDVLTYIASSEGPK